MMRDLSIEDQPFKPYINDFSDKNGGFDFAIGYIGAHAMDPTIGFIEVNEITQTFENIDNKISRTKLKRPLEL
jgi:hypothetical protein